jgi:hypothetical protein
MQDDDKGITLEIPSNSLDMLLGQNKTHAVKAYRNIFAEIFTHVWEKCETVNPIVEDAFNERGATKPPPPPQQLPPPSTTSSQRPPPPPPQTPPRVKPKRPNPENNTTINSIFKFGQANHEGPIGQANTREAKIQRDPEYYDAAQHKLKALTDYVSKMIYSLNYSKGVSVQNNEILDDINKMRNDNIFPDKQIEYITDLMAYLELNNEYNKFTDEYKKKLNKDVANTKLEVSKSVKNLNKAEIFARETNHTESTKGDADRNVKVKKDILKTGQIDYNNSVKRQQRYTPTYNNNDVYDFSGGRRTRRTRHTRRKSRVGSPSF